VRPAVPSDPNTESPLEVVDSTTVRLRSNLPAVLGKAIDRIKGAHHHNYKFTGVFAPEITQRQVFDVVALPLVKECLAGKVRCAGSTPRTSKRLAKGINIDWSEAPLPFSRTENARVRLRRHRVGQDVHRAGAAQRRGPDAPRDRHHLCVAGDAAVVRPGTAGRGEEGSSAPHSYNTCRRSCLPRHPHS